MFIATTETEHFSWIALGETMEEAREAWRAAFRQHVAQRYGEDAVDDWFALSFDGEDPADWYGLNVIRLEPGQCARDGGIVEIPLSYRLKVNGEDELHMPKLDEARTRFLCPVCGNDDVAAWADDGEADLADWWHCELREDLPKERRGCGAQGALVRAANPELTQNGCPV